MHCIGSSAGRVATRVAGCVLTVAFASPLVSQQADAAQPMTGGIYSCVDAKGNKLTSDRPIPECSAREQRVLNSDGSVRNRLPPTLTAEEQAEKDARDRAAAAERAAAQDTLRRDRNLRLRYPDEAKHNKARAAALDDIRSAMQASQKRLVALASERKSLLDEAEFYTGKPLPGKLKRLLDANEASTDAQRALIADRQSETVRINKLFDAELIRLRRLWRGEPGDEPGAPR